MTGRGAESAGTPGRVAGIGLAPVRWVQRHLRPAWDPRFRRVRGRGNWNRYSPQCPPARQNPGDPVCGFYTLGSRPAREG